MSETAGKLVEVTQADREAAADYWESQGIGTPESYAAFRSGKRDVDSDLVQAFAKHRLAALSRSSPDTVGEEVGELAEVMRLDFRGIALAANRADLIYLNDIGVRRYTESLDAAMTLAPADMQVSVLLDAIDECRSEDTWLQDLPRYVTAAALRARALASLRNGGEG